jgi:ABC-type multidrug transport system permease subunit
MFGGVINISMSIMIIPIIIYSIIIFGLALYMLSVVLCNNQRLNKICKELGINKQEYHTLVNLYKS